MDLKKKDFIARAALHFKDKQSWNDPLWVCVSRDKQGRMLGWILGFTEDCDEDDPQMVLVADRGALRVFKTIEAVLRFVSDANLSCQGGSITSVRVDFC